MEPLKTELAPSALAELRRVYDIYMAAGPGRLNITADMLRQTCGQLGYRWQAGRQGYLPWTREMLGIVK